MGFSNLFGLLGDDEEDTNKYETSILSDLDIDGDGSIGSKPTSSFEADRLYDDRTDSLYQFQLDGTDVSPSMQNQDDDKGGFFTDRRFLGPLLQTGLGLAATAFAKSGQEKAAKQAAADRKQQMLMELELEKLKYKYGLKGGAGGGGRSGGGSNQRGQQLLSAYQNYIQGVNSINQNQQGSIRNLGNAIAGGYAAGRR
jgi:hypothetical protein